MNRKHRLYTPRYFGGITGLTLVAVIAVVAAIAEPNMLASERLDPTPAASVAAGTTAPVTANDTYFPDRYPAPTEVAEPVATF